jgi:hypothetical protein
MEETDFEKEQRGRPLIELLHGIARRYLAVKMAFDLLGMDIRLAIERAETDAGKREG